MPIPIHIQKKIFPYNFWVVPKLKNPVFDKPQLSLSERETVAEPGPFRVGPGPLKERSGLLRERLGSLRVMPWCTKRGLGLSEICQVLSNRG